MTVHQRPEAAPESATATQDTPGPQKPRFAHRKTGASAAIIYSDEINGAVHCVVRDMSVSGARLLVKESKLLPKANGMPELPTEFTLNIRLDRIAVNCRLVWQKGDEVGVKFTSAPRVLTRPRR